MNFALALVTALVGALVGGGIAAASAWLAGQPVTWRSVLAGAAQGATTGFLGGLTLGLGPLAAALGAGAGGALGAALAGWIRRESITLAGLLVAGLSAAVGGGAFSLLAKLPVALAGSLSGALAATVGTLLGNSLAGRPWSRGLAASVLLAAALGGGLAAMPVSALRPDAALAEARAYSADFARAADRLAPAIREATPPPPPPARVAPRRSSFGSVHGEAPEWLVARIERTVAATQDPAFDGPRASAEDVRAFLDETYEHVREVSALVGELGGKLRPVPDRLEADDTLRGVHDFGERASLRRLDEWLATLDAPPAWLTAIAERARASGASTVDVGKLEPHVAAGLAQRGPADKLAIGLHNLSGHHRGGALTDDALVEAIADQINAMRQPRIYRPTPMSFAAIRDALADRISKGALPEHASRAQDARTTLDLVDDALAAEARLEKSGVVNPYHRLEAEPPAPSPTSGLVGAIGESK